MSMRWLNAHKCPSASFDTSAHTAHDTSANIASDPIPNTCSECIAQRWWRWVWKLQHVYCGAR